VIKESSTHEESESDKDRLSLIDSISSNSYNSRWQPKTKVGFESHILKKMRTDELMDLKYSVVNYLKGPQKFKNEEYNNLFKRIVSELAQRHKIFITTKDESKLLGKKRRATRDSFDNVKVPSFFNDLYIVKKQKISYDHVNSYNNQANTQNNQFNQNSNSTDILQSTTHFNHSNSIDTQNTNTNQENQKSANITSKLQIDIPNKDFKDLFNIKDDLFLDSPNNNNKSLCSISIDDKNIFSKGKDRCFSISNESISDSIKEIEKGIFTYDDTKHNFYLSDEEDNVEYLKYNCVSKSKQDPVRNNEILQTKKEIELAQTIFNVMPEQDDDFFLSDD